ncbi:YpdA family putative bacillithiol disulfide reductase [Alicyclobacillus mali]|uniref:YpdA family putative bacillithiol disulfide reductase n=1 Tax=Alicyclobacillus mali (ex Roth et al. 2021) TaxID=1123961 RepID=A0ABS0F2P0_9BACL|nr:YpdA family putative bacillithiol disulfide reductase [Alicyclobacillus mali (ex Roth et al. 2021)]MBF8377569.1 YpdA family putative bacillithiol disulfide reductase [Alicyclobacillus mali (ex Roth et al. 2021)]MCL6489099.1 YpdA family putative bacillithiol disulfide reductase [Alicyclobacillus mali (ex Roth et al. 2021)]
MFEACIIGAGPCGLAVSVELKRRSIPHVVIEKSCIVSTIYRFPTQMVFNSTPERLELGEIPFYTERAKPTRMEAMTYYRTVVERLQLPVRQYEEVISVERGRELQGFRIHSRTLSGRTLETMASCVVVATGYFDQPNMLGVPGEDLPHVSHYYRDAHPYYGQRVVIIGGTNSAAEAAIDLHRIGAQVTLVHRGAAMSDKIKPWVKPDIQSLIDKQAIDCHFRSRVAAICADHVRVETPGGPLDVPCDHVLALTGYHPDTSFLEKLGVQIAPETGIPVHDEATYETNVPGIYVAGVVVSGFDANRIFIENGRLQAPCIADAIASRVGARVS